jgi:hypothetical protein
MMCRHGRELFATHRVLLPVADFSFLQRQRIYLHREGWSRVAMHLNPNSYLFKSSFSSEI